MSDEFDVDELLAFAINAIEKGNLVDALAFTKRAFNTEPQNERVVFLLASIHAQLGLGDKAIQELSDLCEHNCGIPEAYFQLGLMLFISGNRDRAQQSWEILNSERFSHAAYLTAFKNGLIDFEDRNYRSAISHIDSGLSASSNPSLNKDMLHIKELAQNKLLEIVENSQELENHQAKKPSHVYLNAYKDS